MPVSDRLSWQVDLYGLAIRQNLPEFLQAGPVNPIEVTVPAFEVYHENEHWIAPNACADGAGDARPEVGAVVKLRADVPWKKAFEPTLESQTVVPKFFDSPVGRMARIILLRNRIHIPSLSDIYRRKKYLCARRWSWALSAPI